MAEIVTENEPVEHPRKNPFSQVSESEWGKLLGMFVSIARKDGRILEAAADYDTVQELTRQNHRTVLFRTLAITNFQVLSPETLEQLKVWAASRQSGEPE